MARFVGGVGRVIVSGLATVLGLGCANEKAVVNFPQVIEAAKPLPRDLRTVAVVPVTQPAQSASRSTHTNVYAELAIIVGPGMTDRASYDVSGPAADVVMARLQREIDRQGLSLKIVDRETFQQQLRERDLAMSDLVSPDGVVKLPGMAPVDALVVVKSVATTNVERVPQETFSVGDISRAISTDGKYVSTTPKMSVHRQITVNTSCRVTVSTTGLVHDSFTLPLSQTDKSQPFILAGDNMAEANLPPGAEVVQKLLDRQTEQFVGRIIGAETRGIATSVKPSNNADSKLGVRYVNSQSWPEALEAFKRALAANPSDHQSAFGAGVAAEQMGSTAEALEFYQTAVRLDSNGTYAEAVKRTRGKLERERREPGKGGST